MMNMMMEGNHTNEEEEQHDEEEEEDEPRRTNTLPIWGNESTMNLNTLLLANIQGSHYFKVNLFALKTYHEVIDEIYYNVTHMEPWEKGSRKTAGQTGMCGGVRGVGVGGIVSTAFSCLYKLYTLRLSRKQVLGLLNHTDSPYLRGVGFLYLRYTQPPADLWTWFEPYLDDEEMIDIRAGGGEEVTIGTMLRKMLTKLDWYGTLFPRIPVPIQMKLQKLLKERFPPPGGEPDRGRGRDDRAPPRVQTESKDKDKAPARDIADEIAIEKDRIRREREGSGAAKEQPGSDRERASRDRRDSRERRDSRAKDRDRKPRSSRSRSRDRKRRSRSRDRGDRDRRRRSRSRSRDRKQRDGDRNRRRSRSGDRKRSRDRSGERRRSRDRQSRRSRSRERKGSRERDRADRKRSRSRDRKPSKERASKRSRSKERSDRRSRSKERADRRSRSRDKKSRRSRSRESEQRRREPRSRSRDRRR